MKLKLYIVSVSGRDAEVVKLSAPNLRRWAKSTAEAADGVCRSFSSDCARKRDSGFYNFNLLVRPDGHTVGETFNCEVSAVSVEMKGESP